jgi:SAM-dependent methyltransferase
VTADPTFDATVPLDAPLAEQVASVQWYHTFDLPGGITTVGYYDHRRAAKAVPLPDLTGKRCLDAASADGFWAFRMAELGAASVVSVDLDDASLQDWQGQPETSIRRAGTGRAHRAFDVVNRARRLEVERQDLSVYDISPENVGTFDFVFLGNVLIHLRDPQRALLALRSVCRGEFVSLEVISVALTVLRPFTPCGQLWDLDEPRWWTPNARAHRRLVEAAGFELIAGHWPVFQPFGRGVPRLPRSIPRRPRDWAWWTFVRPFGPAGQWLRCRPA